MLQREVAEKLGLTTSTIVNWEQGKTTPLPKDGPKVVAFLGYLPLPTVTLAEQLFAVRFVNGWTQGEAGAACGISEDSWSAYEGGKTPAAGKVRRVQLLAEQALMSTPAPTGGNRDTPEVGAIDAKNQVT